MKKLNIVWQIIFCALVGCAPAKPVLDTPLIKTITVRLMNYSGSQDSLFNITEYKKIEMIGNLINSNDREISLFKAKYELIFKFKDETKRELLCNGHFFKINGLTYKVNSSIDDLIIGNLSE